MKYYKNSAEIIQISLFVLGSILTCLYIFLSDFSFTILTKKHDPSTLTSTNDSYLLKGHIISGSFTAHDDYLGIVLVQLDSFGKKNQDIMRFRIKEQGAMEWYYEQDIDASKVYGDPLFPFGIPAIENSQGIEYTFEIESLSGTERNAIALDHSNPKLLSKYQYPRSLLFQDLSSTITFINKKLLSSLENFSLMNYVFAYFLPFVLFTLRKPISTIVMPCLRFLQRYIGSIPLLKREEWLMKIIECRISESDIRKRPIFSVTIALLTLNIFFVPFFLNGIIWTIIILWVMSLRMYKLNAFTSFTAGFTLLFLSPFLYVVTLEIQAQKSATWAVIFICIGVFSVILKRRNMFRFI